MLRIFFSLFAFVISTNAVAKTKAYGEAHLGISDGLVSSTQLDRQSFFIGLKGRSTLKSGKVTAYKFEVGRAKTQNTNNSNNENSVVINYLFIGLKGKNGEFRIGRHDLPYDIVDNSMNQFFSYQSNGLITRNNPKEILSYINRFGDYGVFASLTPSKGNAGTISSVMVNRATAISKSQGSFYVGFGLLKESASTLGPTKAGSKLVLTYKTKHNNNKFGLGYIYEHCPSNRVATVASINNGSCSLLGGDSVHNIAMTVQHNLTTFSAQLAVNNKTSVKKQTIEVRREFGEHFKTYLELDKTGSNRIATVGLIAKFK